MTDDQILRMLSSIPEGHVIALDGHDLRDATIREVASVAVKRGWLDLGELVEGDQWSWYEAKVTPAGRLAIAALRETS